MNCARFFCTAILLMVFAGKIFPQENPYLFSRIDITKGLSNNQVNCFFKDKQGFLWVGTNAGLNRYDGYGFKVFRHNGDDSTTLADDNISQISEGPGHQLWIGTSRGINIFDPGTGKVIRNTAPALHSLGIPGNQVLNVKTDNKGNFFFVTDKQVLSRYNSLSGKTVVLFKSILPHEAIVTFIVDPHNKCYIIHNNGILSVLNAENGRMLEKDSTPARVLGKNNYGYSMFLDSENELWIHQSRGAPTNLLRLNLPSRSFILYKNNKDGSGLNTNLILGVEEDNSGKIWVCTDHGGVNMFNKRTNRFRYLLHNDVEKNSLSQNSITACYKDNNGIIWLGTYKQGIAFFHENIIKFPVFKKLPGNFHSLPFNDVNRFAEDAKGNLWIGTNGDGLIYFNRTTHTYKQFKHEPGKNSISNDVIVSLLVDHQQRLWVGTYFGGLDCYANGKFTHYKNDSANKFSISDNSIWELYEDSKKNIWIGTLAGGLHKFNPEKNNFQTLNPAQQAAINTSYISAIAEDEKQRIWIGTDNGVDVLNEDGQISHFVNYDNKKEAISNNYIFCLFRDSRNIMWIGTRNGLNVFNKEKRNFQSFKTEHGLPGNTILNILEDNRGRLWISTTNGLASITVEKVENGKVAIKTVSYDELDGLQGLVFNENAALKTSKGEMVFGGSNGFNLFNPSLIQPYKTASKVVFTDFQLFNRSIGTGEKTGGRILLPASITETKEITLKYNENMLALEFACLNFFNPDKVKYAYRLEGFNKEWIYASGKNRSAVYTNLDPGSYTFRVKASNEDGQWGENEAVLYITIQPPFWKTPWAYLLYAGFIFLALFLARRFLLERARMRFEVENQRNEAERIQQLDALKTKFFTNISHEFRTPLSLVLLPLEKIVKKTADPAQKKQLQLVQRNAKRLMNLVNQLLDFRKMEVQEFPMHLSQEDIISFVREVTYSFSDVSEKKNISLHFSSDTEKLETYFDKDKLEKIIFNLLSNAFKYTHSGGNVCVAFSSFTQEEGRRLIQIQFTDTGIGIPPNMHEKIFERFYQYSGQGAIQNSGTGIGLAITQEFVKLHGGNISVKSELDKGACFTVTLPVREIQEYIPFNQVQEEIVMKAEVGKPTYPPSEEGLSPDKVGISEENTQKETLLLIEDNEDFRFYLKDNLKSMYEVLEATNGRDGWKKAKEFLPDMVVSDVMMPEMTGIELLKRMKNDPRTSHIPLILLTAMGSEETELQGLRAGSNDYLTKPFTFEILAARIRNILQLRAQLRKKFQQQLEITPAEITVTSLDEEFMKNALAAVEKNMDNPEYSVEELSRHLFMSRAGLYKKLLSVTGKTPIEFIRVIRLKRAAQLLQKSQKSIAEVAYEVGFNSPKLFTKYFKEEFGTTPSAYLAKK